MHHNSGTNFSFVDGHCEYRQWKDPRTMEFGKSMTVLSESQPDNEDMRRTQAAAWGDAPQPSSERRGPHAGNR